MPFDTAGLRRSIRQNRADQRVEPLRLGRVIRMRASAVAESVSLPLV